MTNLAILTGVHFSTDDRANAPVTSVSGGAPAQHPRLPDRAVVSTLIYFKILWPKLERFNLHLIFISSKYNKNISSTFNLRNSRHWNWLSNYKFRICKTMYGILALLLLNKIRKYFFVGLKKTTSEINKNYFYHLSIYFYIRNERTINLPINK